MKNFISTKEAESVVKPVSPLIAPTLAAQEGLSYRFAKGYSAKRQVKGIKGIGKEIEFPLLAEALPHWIRTPPDQA